MDLSAAIRLFLEHRRRQRRSTDTLLLYEIQLSDWERWRRERGHGPRLRDVGLAELRAYFHYLEFEAPPQRGRRRGGVGLAPQTIHGYYRTLRGLWKFLEFEEDEDGEPLLLPKQLRYFHNSRIALPEIEKRERPAITEEQFRALLGAAAGDDEESARDRAILWLLWESGLRVSELAKLMTADVDLTLNQARIVGKGKGGGKEAAVFWGPTTRAALLRYLRLRRGPLPGPLFRGVASRNLGEGCTANLVRCMIKRRAKQAGVTLPLGSPCHAFRHAFARRLRERGCTKQEVGELLRDSTPEVVDTYCGLDIAPLRALYQRAFGAMMAEQSAAEYRTGTP